MSSKNKILKHLINSWGITVKQGAKIANTNDVRKRISELRHEGWNIYDQWKSGKKGIRYKEYYLDHTKPFEYDNKKLSELYYRLLEV